MHTEVRLSRVEGVLAELSYPISKDDAADELDDVTLVLADGEENLGQMIEQGGSESYESANELEDELYNVLPREAVGEPYQSEGEG